MQTDIFIAIALGLNGFSETIFFSFKIIQINQLNLCVTMTEILTLDYALNNKIFHSSLAPSVVTNTHICLLMRNIVINSFAFVVE